jgi:hypothetical protein
MRMDSATSGAAPRERRGAILRLVIGLLAIVGAGAAGAADVLDDPRAPAPDLDPLFAERSVLALRLTGPIREIADDRRAEPEQRPATLAWTDADGAQHSLGIQLRARGKSRRDKDLCAFPPLRLNLRTSEAKGTLFENQDKLKLVTHCERLGRPTPRARDQVDREYLAYRLLSQITDASFRVRLTEVTYVDTDGREDTHPGFLIEADDRLAARLGLAVSDRAWVQPDALAPALASRVAVFQFLIGNTDFSLIRGPEGESCCHNAVLLTDGERFVSVPYDFDMTGLVDRPGATPAAGLGVRRVTQRVFRGFCRAPGVLEAAVAAYVEVRPAIERVVAQEGRLSDRARREVERFVARFYDVLDSPRRLRRQVLDACREAS